MSLERAVRAKVSAKWKYLNANNKNKNAKSENRKIAINIKMLTAAM